MRGFARLITVLVVLSVVGTGAFALWRRKDQVKELWDTVGGVDGVIDSADKLIGSVGPVKDFVTRLTQLKK